MTSNISENHIFIGSSEMALLMRSIDWSQTSLGAVETWSQSLKTAVQIMLTSRQAMFVWWGDDLINLYNDAYRAILGGKHPEALGQAASVVWCEIWDQVGPRAEMAMLKNEGTYDEALLLIMERNGYPEETYYTFSYSPVPDDDGSTGGIICANTDDTIGIIGERQLALLRELAAKTADARTFDTACTLSANCLATNPSDLPFALIYLVDVDQEHVTLAGTCGIERGHPAVSDTIAISEDRIWHLAEVLKTHEPYLISDLEAQFPDLPMGAWNRSPHQIVVMPIASSGREGKAGILIVGLNPYRLFDDNYRGFLNLVSAQIAASIANAQAYEEERKRAEALAELDRAKTTFFSNISHEFRTPLTLMLSPLEDVLALDGAVPAPQRQQLELVHRNSLRLLKLVNTLLDFSRIEAGRVQAVYEPTDLAAFTAELASVFRSAIEQAGLQFVITCHPLAEPVYIDREMWEKVVLNLLSNAFKFTFTGEIRISLGYGDGGDRGDGGESSFSAAQSSPPSLSSSPSPCVILTVQDTGIGIPSSELPQLFERFHRVEGARGRTQEGSGIGLALVQELVHLHGGKVQVSSIEGAGTTFTISIPLGTAHLPPDRIQATRTIASTALGAVPYVEEALRWIPEETSELSITNFEPGFNSSAQASEYSLQERYELAAAPVPQSYKTQNLKPARILLVDDNADMREYVKRLLSNQYEVEAATNGLTALNIIRQSVEGKISQSLPNLVLTDVMMPELDGFGLLNALRSDDRTREIPVIMLSARAGEEAKVEGLQAGADDYLTKPFSARELLAKVEATLKLGQLRRETTQQEQALRLEAETAKQSVERILSSINDGFFILDRNWCYTYVNKRNCEIIRMEQDEVLGKNIWKLFPDMVDTEVYQQFQQSMREQTSAQFEYFYPTWNRWFEYRVYPSPDALALFVTDISDRVRAEAALRESEARFRGVVESNMMGIFFWDDSGFIVDGNQMAVQMLGYSLEDLQAKKVRWEDITPPEFHETDAMMQAQILSEGRCPPFEKAYIRKNGTQVPILIGGALLPGYSDRGVAYFIDISDRKQAEAALLESSAILNTINQATPNLIYVKDRQGRIVMANPATIRLLGQPTANIIGNTVREFLGGNEAEQIRENDRRVIENGQVEVFEETVVLPEGTRIFLSTKSPYYNKQGKIIGLIGVSTDITDRKQAEREREQLLAREQAARESAEAANRIKDEFLAVLSHELRSPLNPILGWARLLQTGNLDEVKTRQALATIERNAKLQAELIEDLLNVSRILRGKLGLTVSPVNLASTIKAAIETVRLAAEAKSIQLSTFFASEAVQVAGDATRLQQIVWNLLSNAVKFTPEGGRVDIHLALVNRPSGEDSSQPRTNDPGQMTSYAQIVVTDTGKGISSSFLPHVFDYFRQADSATTRKFGGLGLGLAIVRHLVELHGGTIHADSQGEDKGATFTVRLPLMPVSPNVNQGARSAEADLNLSGINILVVDDDDDTREFVAYLLEAAGANVTIAAAAMSALISLKQSQPDILLSDIGMPEMDGYMLLRQVRKLPPEQGGNIPAIALTAYAGEINHQQALAAGFQLHLSKPIEPVTLITAIANLINK